MNRKSNPWLELERIVDKFMSAYPSACHRQSKNINRPPGVSERIPWVEEFIIYKETCICRNRPSRVLRFVTYSISSQNNSLKIDCFAIINKCVLNIFSSQQFGNRAICKYLNTWIFLKKCFEGLEMIMISMFVRKKYNINIGEL